MKKEISKPSNAEDFENLCMLIFGELWSIPHKIKKNGRSGFNQDGVDIYGKPDGQDKFFGIQCKCKSENLGSKLTKGEIDKEVSKAQNFEPKLKVLIIATSANNDPEIEKYVRFKSEENLNIGSFEVLIYQWQDLEDLIRRYQKVKNYWVRERSHIENYSFKVRFSDDSDQIVLNPKFVKKIKRYRLREDHNMRESYRSQVLNPSLLKALNFKTPTLSRISGNIVNEAICSFRIVVTNTGGEAIRNWKLVLSFDGEFSKLFDQSGEPPFGMLNLNTALRKQTQILNDQIIFTPREKILVQKDSLDFESYIIPGSQKGIISVGWELIAEDFNQNGKLFLQIEPEIENDIIYELVESEDDLQEDRILSIEPKRS